MKKLFAILALSSTLLLAAACNTVRGAGQDVQSAANAVDDDDLRARPRRQRRWAPARGRLFYASVALLAAAPARRFRSVNQIAISETS